MGNAKLWIDKLQLQKHPEGGWFKEVCRSEELISESELPTDFKGDRNLSTSIYYLLEGSDFSTFHRIKSDEIWHFYTGSSAVDLVSCHVCSNVPSFVLLTFNCIKKSLQNAAMRRFFALLKLKITAT